MEKAVREDAILKFALSEAVGLNIELRVEPRTGDGYEITPVAAGYRITGANARSCLYGVYHLKAGRPAGRFRAAFSIRGINTCESLASHTPAQLTALIDKMGRWRMNTLIVHVNYGWRFHRKLIVEECGKRGIDLTFYTYTSIVFLPKDAPARWLAKDTELKPITNHPECETRLCLNQQEGLQAFENGAVDFFREAVSDATSVLAMTGDGYGHCRCEYCRHHLPVEQWQPLLKRFAAAGRLHAPDKLLETIIYVNRYALPRDPETMLSMDRLFFDLHQRCRWRELGADHPPVWHREKEVDSRAGDVSLNRYLLDRLSEWRSRSSGAVYGFENLYVHGSLSCPQPNTGVLLADLKTMQEMGINGMVYEVLVGMESFEAQLQILAEALWDPQAVKHEASELERWCSDRCPAGTLFFLKDTGFPWDRFKSGWDVALARHMANLREFLAEPTAGNLSQVIEHMYSVPERFHRQFISFQLLKQHAHNFKDVSLNDVEKRFLGTTKLWDYMERLSDPVAETDLMIRGIAGKLR